MKLYRCKKAVHCWLQPQNLSPACPYAITGTCSDVEEVIIEQYKEFLSTHPTNPSPLNLYRRLFTADNR